MKSCVDRLHLPWSFYTIQIRCYIGFTAGEGGRAIIMQGKNKKEDVMLWIIFFIQKCGKGMFEFSFQITASFPVFSLLDFLSFSFIVSFFLSSFCSPCLSLFFIFISFFLDHSCCSSCCSPPTLPLCSPHFFIINAVCGYLSFSSPPPHLPPIFFSPSKVSTT